MDDALNIVEMGAFHVGGREIAVENMPVRDIDVNARSGRAIRIDPNGTYHAGQMYCQYFVPENVRGKCPLQFWHGGGMTGATWETTPDGRQGWLDFFLRKGWRSFLCDAVERGRSGWTPLHAPFRQEEPVLAAKHYAFERYRIGLDYAAGQAFPGGQFPLESFDAFMMQFVPRWTGTTDATVDAYIELLRKTGPSAIVAHSQGATLAFTVMEAVPELVTALVAVEPYATGSSDMIDRVRRIPVLFVLGDFMEQHPAWAESKAVALRHAETLCDRGGNATVLDLPALGISGNSHMLMMEKNNRDIAALVQNWLEKNSLYVASA